MQNFTRKVTSGILAAVIAFAPILPNVKVIADEVAPQETIEVSANETENTEQTTVAVSPITSATTVAEPDYSEPVDEETPETTVEVTDPSDSIDTTAPPTEETEATSETDATEATTSDTEETTTVEPSDTEETTEATEPTESSETSETSETAEPSETPTPTPEVEEITCVTVCETLVDYNNFIAGLKADTWKIYVNTTDDLTEVSYDDGRYFDGQYCFVFNTEEKFNTAVNYLTENEYEFTKIEAVKESKIVIATSMEEFITYISGMIGTKLIINTTANIDELEPDYGVYFEGTYVIGFADQSAYFNAVTYCANKGYEYSIDGDMEVCGEGDTPVLGTINPNASIKVAVIDTGSTLANEAYCVLDGDDGYDRNGHGTRMVNNILGLTDNAYIISIKALGDDGHGNISDVYNAVQFAKELGVDYILLAMSVKDNGEYDAFKSLIDECEAQGITVVASAGNNNKSASEYVPANCATYSIGALNADLTKNVFSNIDANYYVVANTTSDAASLFIGGKIAGIENYETSFKSSDDEGTDEDVNEDDGGASAGDFSTHWYNVEMTYEDDLILGINTTKVNGVHIHVYGTYHFYSRVYCGTNGASAPTVNCTKEEIDAYRARLPATVSANMTDKAIATSILSDKVNDYMRGRRTFVNNNIFSNEEKQKYKNRVGNVYNDMIDITGIVDDGGYDGTITDITTYIDGTFDTNSWGTGYYAAFNWVTEANYNWDVKVKATYSDDGATLSSANATIYGLKRLGAQGYDFIGTSDPEETVNYNTVANNLNNAIINANNGSKAVRLDGNGVYDGSGAGGHWGNPYTYCMQIHTGYGGELGTPTYYEVMGFAEYAEPDAKAREVSCPQNQGGNNNVHDISLVLGSDKTPADKQGWVWQYLCESAGITIEESHKNVSIPNESSFSIEGTYDTGVKYDLAIDYTGQTMVGDKLLVVPGQTYRLPVSIIDKHTGGKPVNSDDVAPDAQRALLNYVKAINNANTGLTVTLDTNVTNASTTAGYIIVDATNVNAINFGVLGAGATMTIGGGQTIDNKFTYPNNTPYSQWYDYEVWGYNRSGQDQIRGAFKRYNAQYHANGLDLPVITNLYVYVQKESANDRSYNNCYSMEGVTFRMEGNSKTYQFTQPMGQTGGSTQAIKLTVDDIVSNDWGVYENDGTLPVRNFNGFNFNSGYLYDTARHEVNYTTAYYDPTVPVQGGGYATDGAVIRVLIQDVPVGDPINQNIKKEDDEKWDEINDQGIATTNGIQFTVYYYADYFYDASSVVNSINGTRVESTALKNYFDTHTPTITQTYTLTGNETNKYGMFLLNGKNCPEFSLDGGYTMRYGTYIVRETKSNNMYYLNDEPLFGTVTSQRVNGNPYGGTIDQLYFYNGTNRQTLFVRPYSAQIGDAMAVVYNDDIVYGYARLEKENVLPTLENEPLNGYAQGISIEDTVYGIFSQDKNRLYAVVVLAKDGSMKSVTYAPDLNVTDEVAPKINLEGGKEAQYIRLATGNYYATEIKPVANDIFNAGTFPDGTTNPGTDIVEFHGQVINASMFYYGMEYSYTSGHQGEKLMFTVNACPKLTVGETPSANNVTVVKATDYPSNAEFDFYLNKKAYNGWNYIGAEFTLYYDEACTQPIMTLTDNNDGHYVSNATGNIRDYLTFSPSSYTVDATTGNVVFSYNQKVYLKETKAPTILRDANGQDWNIPEFNQSDIHDGDSVYTIQIDYTNVSQTTHIGTLTYTISGGQVATPYSVTIQNYHATESHNHADNGTASEVKNIVLSNYMDNVFYEDSMSLALLKTTDTPFLDINDNGRDDAEDYHFDIRTTTFYVTSGELAGGYPTFTMAQLKNAKAEGRNLLKEYMLSQDNLLGYYEFGEDQWYDRTGTKLPTGWDRLYGLDYDTTYYIYEVFEVPEYAYDNDNDPNPPGQNGVYDIAGEIYEIVTNQNGQTSRINTERTYSSIPYPNIVDNSTDWTQSSYFNTMWEMHFDTPTSTAEKMGANEDSITYSANNHLMSGDINLSKIWSEDNTDSRTDLAGYEFLFEYGGNLDRAYWDMDSSEMEAVGMPSYDEMPHTYIIRTTDVNGNIKLSDIPAGWYRISENTTNMEVRFHSDRGADQQARAVIKLTDKDTQVFYVVNIMDVPIYVNKYDTWTGEPIVIDPFTGEKRAYEGDYSLRFELYSDANRDGKITGAEKDNVRTIVDRSHSGIVAFNALKSGQYAAREIITADGYYLDTGYRFITIYDLNNNGTITDDIFEIKMYDEPYSAPITIEKLNSETKEPITDAEFTIYYDDGDVVGEWDENDTRAMTFEPQLDENGNQMYEQIKCGYYDIDQVWHDQLDPEGNQVYIDGKPLGTYRPAEVWYDATQGKYVSDPLRAYHVWNSTTGQFEHRNYVVVESKLPYGYSFADVNGEPVVKPDQAIFAIEYPDMQAEASGRPEFYMDEDYQIQPIENDVKITVQNFVMYNAPIRITTEAISIQNENHTLEVGESVDVKETINYENLAPTGRYTFRTLLLDKDNLDVDNPIATGSVSIVAENKNGSTSVTFTGVNSAELVKAIVNADGTVTYKTKDLVCFVYCDWDSDFDRYDGQRADHTDPNDTNETVTIENPTLHTTLTGTVTMTHNGLVGNTVDFNDKIEFTNLSIGEEYYTITSIVDKATGTVLTIKDADGNDVTELKTTFVVPDTATKGNGTTTVNMVVDTSKLLTATTDANGVTTITGKDIVCFEKLYTASGIYIATHEDVTDTAQTVTVVPPTISTTFVDSVTNEHLTPIGQDVPLTDIVKVTDNLNPNESYYVIGSIMNAETGEALIDKETGKPIEVRKDFTTTAENYNNITVNVDFSVDTVDFVEWDATTNTLKTTKMVCFERLYAADGTLIAVHEDLKDENQTIAIVAPTLHTTLIDVASNSHRGSLGTAVVIRDKVDYENASVGTTYTFRGQIWSVKADGTLGEKLFDGDSDTVFTATERTGTQYVTFSGIDSTKLCNDGQPVSIVCFEYMYCKAMVDDDNDDTTPTVEKEVQIASHEDVTDQNQRIEFKPELQTTLLVVKGENDGDNFDNKLVLDNTVQTYVDTVHHYDLVVGEEYVVTASLVDQETGSQLYRSEGGEALTVTQTYTPTTATGDYDVEFKDVDSGTFGYYRINEETGEQEFVKPNQIVAFETLTSKTGFVFDLHKDLTDENQTIHRPHYLRVKIAKMDADNVKYYLSGAEITIYTGDGQVALDVDGNPCVGVTNDEGMVEFVIRYVDGQTYYAKETKAPAGYHLNEDKHNIKVLDTTAYGKEEIIPVSVFDRMIIIPPHPKTGDTTPIMALVALVVIGAVGMTAVFVTKSKKKSQIEGNTSIEGVSNESPENDQN